VITKYLPTLNGGGKVMGNLTDGEFIVRFNGLDHWIKIEGSGNGTTPLVVIHGGPGGNHYVFERAAGPLLAQTRTLVYYEQRGCGRSEKPEAEDDYTIPVLIDDFKELKKWLGTGNLDLLGYSFGAELALEISNAFPEEVNRIILSAPSLMNTDIQKMVQITGFLSVADLSLYKKISDLQQEGLSLAETYDRVWGLADRDTVDALLFENREAAVENRKLWEESNLINTGLMMNTLMNNPMEIPLISRLAEIKNPALILTGVFDRNTGIPISKLIHKNLENSRIVLFEKSAHFPDLEETEKFLKIISDFLES
jgi:proline iminopeptidase